MHKVLVIVIMAMLGGCLSAGDPPPPAAEEDDEPPGPSPLAPPTYEITAEDLEPGHEIMLSRPAGEVAIARLEFSNAFHVVAADGGPYSQDNCWTILMRAGEDLFDGATPVAVGHPGDDLRDDKPQFAAGSYDVWGWCDEQTEYRLVVNDDALFPTGDVDLYANTTSHPSASASGDATLDLSDPVAGNWTVHADVATGAYTATFVTPPGSPDLRLVRHIDDEDAAASVSPAGDEVVSHHLIEQTIGMTIHASAVAPSEGTGSVRWAGFERPELWPGIAP